ncbi:inhibitor of KinA [Mesonia phycicola]|uniref:Inhibitor of KinA n=1 Tax=Mesonia phycicola TaxID=579105 RepID=A0A1M6DTZ4_9FLAO|nr:allophanate hydrolase subunit 1 [Mesonia phycicola]SHI76609.1 inhibitor of KinA [Mesonia phycicola]
MKYGKPNIQPLGEQAILLTWDEIIDENLLYFLLEIKQKILNHYSKVKVEVVNTYNSLLINYGFTINNIYDEISPLKKIVDDKIEFTSNSFCQFTLPVCYDDKFGIDLALLSEQNKLSISEIIQLHTQPNYTIYFTGFLPGFLYLGGLEKKLHISRKKSPRLNVEKGAVAIGEKQTGIYPQKSAGGWQIIGKCPVPIFDVNSKKPSPFQSGDKLRFESISLEEYQLVKEEVNAGKFQLKKELYER